MCGLCDEDKDIREKERYRLRFHAMEMEKMADYLKNLAAGQVSPHDLRALKDNPARSIIRYLVEEWM